MALFSSTVEKVPLSKTSSKLFQHLVSCILIQQWLVSLFVLRTTKIMRKKCCLRTLWNITDQGLMMSRLCLKIVNLSKGIFKIKILSLSSICNFLYGEPDGD